MSEVKMLLSLCFGIASGVMLALRGLALIDVISISLLGATIMAFALHFIPYVKGEMSEEDARVYVLGSKLFLAGLILAVIVLVLTKMFRQ